MKKSLPDRLEKLNQGKWKKFATLVFASERGFFPA